MSLLEVEGLTKRYGDRTVVDGVSYHVDAGEIVGLLGPNGAGKTTTFRMTVGMVRPDEGSVSLEGEEITRLPMYKRARRGMGYLSQEPSIFRHMSVTENLLAVLEARGAGRRERRERVDELLEDLGLEHVAHSRSTTLSGGERRRLELARTLALDPSLILLDEPFSGVDPIAVEDIQHHLEVLRDQGIAVLITDHAVRETLSSTDRAYIIYEGQIFRHGDAETLAEDPKVREVYLGETFTMETRERPTRRRGAEPAAEEGDEEGEPDAPDDDDTEVLERSDLVDELPADGMAAFPASGWSGPGAAPAPPPAASPQDSPDAADTPDDDPGEAADEEGPSGPAPEDDDDRPFGPQPQ